MRGSIGVIIACLVAAGLGGAVSGFVIRFAWKIQLDQALRASEGRQIGAFRAMLQGKPGEPPDKLPDREPEDETWAEETKSVSDMRAARTSLGDHPEPERLAALLDASNGWLPIEGEEAEFQAVRDEWVDELRRIVGERVRSLQNEVLHATDGTEALKKHARASRVLALYPISQEDAVLDEAHSLAKAQSELLRRIEVIRRQRYNLWAVNQIEAALDAYHSADKNVEIGGRSDDQQLVEAAVTHLAEIDPAILEPAALNLYNYALDLIKSDVSEWWRIEFAKRLVNPEVSRKTLEDF